MIKKRVEFGGDLSCWYVRCCKVQDVLCKSLRALAHYSTIANIAWMFVEGLFLHHRVAVCVFRTTDPFHLYYAIGWGLFVCPMHRHSQGVQGCWLVR